MLCRTAIAHKGQSCQIGAHSTTKTEEVRPCASQLAIICVVGANDHLLSYI